MKLKLAVLPGDGIGPEIIEQALNVVKSIVTKFNHDLHYSYGSVGAVAIDKYGDPYPEETHQLCLNADAVLFGAIGDPKYDNDPKAKIRPEQGLLRMRKLLGLYANIRPVITFPSLLDKSPLKREIIEDVDFVSVRELTGGIYFGKPQGRSEDGKTAYDTCVYHEEEILRILKTAFEIAMKRNKKLMLVDKANVLSTSRLWREAGQKMKNDYPEVKLDYMFVDNAAMQMILWPKQFDVIVTENMFGDILSDESSVISGSLGLLPSASIGEKTSLFEPIHGSYPQVAGKNLANPIATILSAAMMLETAFELKVEADLVKEAVEESIKKEYVTKDIATGKTYYSTSEVGEWICNYIRIKNIDS